LLLSNTRKIMWTEQKQRVGELSKLAAQCAAEMQCLDDQISDWCCEHLGKPDALAWSFAAGVWLAAGRSAPAQPNEPGNYNFVTLMNLTWFARQLVDHIEDK